jgi:FOG: EAL domain
MGVNTTSAMDKLKAQRDRFIAFAFAGADLLLEIRRDEVITYSAGAGEAVYGLSDDDLTGRKLSDFIHDKDRKRLSEALLRLRNTGRLESVPMTLLGGGGAVSRLRMSGIRLPQFPDTFHLVLSRLPNMAPCEPARIPSAADPKAQFADMVRQRMNEANRLGHDYALTLFDLSGTNFSAIEPVLGQSFLATLMHALEECSVRGASAGPLSDHAFGVIHDGTVSAEAVHQRIRQVAAKFADKNGKAAPVRMHSATLDLEDSALSEDDIARAVGHVVAGFLRDSARFSMKSLTEASQAAIEDIMVRVRNFRGMVKGGQKLAFLFQPVVNLRTGAVLNYEAFSRLTHNGGFFVPSQIIPFATEVGLIAEFDLIAVTKALKMLRNPGEVSALAIIAVNVSGHSLGNPAFYQSLFQLLEENRQVTGRLILEVTDSAQIFNLDEARRLLTRIRKLGVRVSLDDFGSSGSAFDLLRFLPVDFAKIDSSYIQEAHDPRGKSVLKAITGLCHDLGIITVGESVEDSRQMQILREVNVDYAQGYYFARPTPDAAKRTRYFKEQVALACQEPEPVCAG